MLIREMYNLASCYDVWLCIIRKEMEVDREQMTHFNASQTKPSLANVADQLQLSDDGTPVLIPTASSLCSFFIPSSVFLTNVPLNQPKISKGFCTHEYKN